MSISERDSLAEGPTQWLNGPGGKDGLFRSLLEALPYASVVIDSEGRLLFVNSQTEKIFGYRRDELLGQPVETLVPERFRGAHIGHRAGYISEPHTRPMGSGLELTGLRKDGTDFPVEISLSPLKTEAGTLITAIIQDVSDRKRLEVALRASEERLRAILDNTEAVIYVKDAQGRYMLVNRRFEKLFHVANPQIVGMTAHDLFPKEFAQVFAENDRKVIHIGVPVALEEVVPQDDGPHTYISMKFSLDDTSGLPYAVCSISVDITERKQMEESLRESERRFRHLAHDQERQLILSERLISFGELTASLAHEFNNPLGIVIGFAQDLLTEVDPSDPRYQSVKIIEEEARRCKKVMKNLLDFGRQTPPQHTQTDPVEMVRKSLELVSPRFQKTGIRTVIENPGGLPKIWADAQQMSQVLVNLYFNALEAMPRGGTLTIGVAAMPSPPADDPAPNDDVIISVTDTGQGIEPGQLSKIFLPFFTTKSKKGMGLGLSICKRIMEAHHGKISVESAPGRGTTFSLYLPADRRRRPR